MRLRTILNLVDDVSPVNYGIWHAAIATSAALWEKYGIESWLISPFFDSSFDASRFPWLRIFRPDSLDAVAAKKFFAGFNPQETVVATHGCWKYPTRWGRAARTLGFPWVYTPHGMLEPWSMEQKAWKKIPYFLLVEKRFALNASLVRAVGQPELENLKKHFPAAVHIPNGIYQSELNPLSRGEASFQSGSRNHFLFLARLHFKKNVLPLAEAWVQSSLSGQPGCALRIAGTDDGEQQVLEAFIRKNPEAGISFLGPVFGEKKKELLADSDFYLLPSLSEGFPTSVVEAAGAGLICLISQGCNFPELLKAGAAMDTGTSVASIRQALEAAAEMEDSQRKAMQKKARQLIETNFIWEEIAQQQASRYAALFDAQKV
jgi:glycosyltransferase involved in cell wall biosynthesis